MNTPLRLVAVCAVPLALAACRHREHAVSPTPPPGLGEAAVEQAKRSAPGAAPFGDLLRGVAVRADDRNDWEIALDPGKCYFISGVGEATVEGLALYLWNPDHKRLETRRERGPRAIIHHCVSQPGMFRIEAKVTDGYGHYAVAVLAEKYDAPVEPQQEKPKEPDLGEVIADMAKSAAPGASRVGELFDGSSDKADWYVQFETGKCYWLFGAGDKRIKELDLYLWDQKNKRITATKPDNNRVNVGYCADKGGMYHFQAKVTSGSGKYKVGVYAKAQ